MIDVASFAEILDCQQKCTFAQNSTSCASECTLKMEKFVKNGKLDANELKNALNKNRNPEMPWDKPINDAIDFCAKEMKSKKKNFKFSEFV